MNEFNKEPEGFHLKEVPTTNGYCDYHLYEGERKIAEFNNKTEAEKVLMLRQQRKEVKNERRR